PAHASRLPLALIATGGALAVAGLAYDLLAVQPARDQLSDPTYASYAMLPDQRSTFETRRTIAISLFAGAAVALVTGAILPVTAAPPRTRVGMTVGADQTLVTLGWER